MMSKRFMVALILAMFALAACGSLSSGGEVSGTWEGVASSSDTSLTLQLSQTSASVNGTLTLGNATAVSLQGTFANSLLSLEGQSEAGKVNIEASIDGDSMKGALAVPAGNGEQVTSPFTATR